MNTFFVDKVLRKLEFLLFSLFLPQGIFEDKCKVSFFILVTETEPHEVYIDGGFETSCIPIAVTHPEIVIRVEVRETLPFYDWQRTSHH
jgi:hypothetical protein